MAKISAKGRTPKPVRSVSTPRYHSNPDSHYSDDFAFEPRCYRIPHADDNFEFAPVHCKRRRIEENFDFEPAMAVEGMDAEIALLRMQVMSILKHDPHNFTLLMQAIRNVCQFVKMRHEINKYDLDHTPGAATKGILEEVAASMGITIRYKDIEKNGGLDDNRKADSGQSH